LLKSVNSPRKPLLVQQADVVPALVLGYNSDALPLVRAAVAALVVLVTGLVGEGIAGSPQAASADQASRSEPQAADAEAAQAVQTGGPSPPTAGAVGTAASDDAAGDAAEGLPEILGPPPPLDPDVIRRDGKGQATVRAVRITRTIELDGRLNDEVYGTIPPSGDFIQQIPLDNVPSTERTEVWVFYDDDNLYIAGRCVDSEPERLVANELRRDHTNVFNGGDNISIVLDTFYDRRNGVFFQTNPLGAVRDQAISEGQQIVAWNTVWDVRSVRTGDGWTFEMEIPFKSLRYRRPGPQVWGINVRRIVKWKNETSSLTALPRSYGIGGISQMHAAGTLVGLTAPPLAKNFEVKPYAVAAVTTDNVAADPFSNDFGPNAGVDVKYGITSSLVADFTVNTDFAQIEEDLQQVNLTRFTLQFPEKRDFFLEGQGTFAFGDRARLTAGSDVPILFFSRRIGLAAGQTVPVQAGARVTGKAGAYDIGLLNIQTGDKVVSGAQIAVPTNFAVVRIKRDVFSRSSIGMIATQRTETSGRAGRNFAGGLDAMFRLSNELTVTGYYAVNDTPGVEEGDTSYRGRFDYVGDKYGLALEHLMVGPEFDPEVGFVRRFDFRRNFAQARYSPRPVKHPYIRRYVFQGSGDYVTNADGSVVENRTYVGNFDIEFHSSDVASADYTHDYEFLPIDFRIAPGVIVPTGEYVSDTVRGAYTLGQQRMISGTVATSYGSFYDGTRIESTYSGRVTFNPRFAIEPSVTLNWVDLPYGDFTARIVSSRFIVTPTPRLSFSSLVQVNASSDTVSSSVRMRWEYVPGSELFVVYSDGRDTTSTTPIGLLNRTFAIKATRLLRF
jgi:hypothetical protein